MKGKLIPIAVSKPSNPPVWAIYPNLATKVLWQTLSQTWLMSK